MVCRNPEAIDHADPVAVIAYELYQRAGCPRGRDLEFWSLAEQQYTASRRLVDAIVKADRSDRPFPAPSMRAMKDRPELVAEELTRAVLLEDRNEANGGGVARTSCNGHSLASSQDTRNHRPHPCGVGPADDARGDRASQESNRRAPWWCLWLDLGGEG